MSVNHWKNIFMPRKTFIVPLEIALSQKTMVSLGGDFRISEDYIVLRSRFYVSKDYCASEGKFMSRRSMLYSWYLADKFYFWLYHGI